MSVDYKKFIPKGFFGGKEAWAREKSLNFNFVDRSLVSLSYYYPGELQDIHTQTYAPFDLAGVRDRFHQRFGVSHAEKDDGTQSQWWFKSGPHPINLTTTLEENKISMSVELNSYHRFLSYREGIHSYHGGTEYSEALKDYNNKIAKIKKMYHDRKTKENQVYSDVNF